MVYPIQIAQMQAVVLVEIKASDGRVVVMIPELLAGQLVAQRL
jgi:hypothetical protein